MIDPTLPYLGRAACPETASPEETTSKRHCRHAISHGNHGFGNALEVCSAFVPEQKSKPGTRHPVATEWVSPICSVFRVIVPF